MFKYIPNILTLTRFLFIPFIIICIINNNYILAFIFILISGITDVLDGFIARKFNIVSDFGKLIDPLADKLTQVSILITLTFEKIIPIWIILIITLKEIIMVCGASFLYGKDLVVSSKWYGKLATCILYIAIVSSLYINQFNINLNFDIFLYFLALLTTVFSLGMYIRAFYLEGYLKKK